MTTMTMTTTTTARPMLANQSFFMLFLLASSAFGFGAVQRFSISPSKTTTTTSTTTTTTKKTATSTSLFSFRKDTNEDLNLPSLVGSTVDAIERGGTKESPSNQYLLRELLPVASAKKCQIYEACPVLANGQQEPTNGDVENAITSVVVKLSANIRAIEWEASAYQTLSQLLKESDRHAFVQTYGMIPPSEATGNCAGLVMERGSDNLRFQIRQKGAYRGTKLKEGMYRVIRIVNTLHEHGLVWTEIKAENFVVLYGRHTLLKGIDLESVIPANYWLKTYSAEACPPEFPVEEIYKSLPKLQISPTFDMWGLGLVLFEMATGKPLYADGLQDIEYIRSQLANIEDTLERANQKLRLSVPAPARGIIQRCLALNPNDRPSCRELLNDPYFQGMVSTSPPSLVI